MGLDVYLHWPNMTEEEKKAQYTGFVSSGKYGYLRQSWGTLNAWNQVFKSIFGTSWSEILYPDWNGYNDGEGPDLMDVKERERLTGNRNLLLSYIENPVLPPPDVIKRYFEDANKDEVMNTIKAEAQDMLDFINLALKKDGAKICFS